MKENKFQKDLKKEIKDRYPDSFIFKMDCNDIQGVPDLLILHGKQWAMLENKRSAKATHRPNQDYYVNKMNDMSFARFIYPENKEDVLNELSEFFKA